MKQLKPITNPKHLEWFEFYCTASSLQEVADKFGIKLMKVKNTMFKEQWAARKADLVLTRYNEQLKALKGSVVRITEILDRDTIAILKDVEKTGRLLTHEERQHLRAREDRLMKEVRLEDGKPTGDGGVHVGAGGRLVISVPPEMAAAMALFADDERSVIEVNADVEDSKSLEDKS